MSSFTLGDAIDVFEKPEAFTFAHNRGDGRDSSEVRLIVDSYSDLRDGSLFLCGHEFGATHLVAARSFEAAWGAWVDELPTIPEEELIEALRPDHDSDSFDDIARERLSAEAPNVFSAEWDAHRARIAELAKRLLSECESPELVEGYEYQSNFTGTGIVELGHHAWMNEISPSEIEVTRKEEKEEGKP